MKAFLGCLLCVVLATAQSFAVSGGPVYPSGGGSLVGTYAGVLQRAFCAAPLPTPELCPGFNSLGVFSLGVPNTGTGSGAFVMFSRGRVFTGTIRAAGNPEQSNLEGVLAASFNYSISIAAPGPNGSVTFQTIPVTATANGRIKADVFDVRNRSSVFASTTTRVQGEANLFVSQGEVDNDGNPVGQEIPFSVIGVKQSNAAPNAPVTGSG
jgi:hypothetical protein